MRYFSMFSGIGGFELGIEQACQELGLTSECVGYSEIDKAAIRTYEEHFNHDNYGDATTIRADGLPGFDLLVGGFPCQAFSVAGRRRGFEDTRGTLFFDIARVLKANYPDYFILENVKGLISHDKGNTFRTILRTLDELGYNVQWKVLNSKDYGCPQNRERVYIVGHLGGTPQPQVFSPSGPGNPYSTVGVTAETAVARTLTAGGNSGGNHSGMTILRTPEGDRRLTPVEWERLQGFPDNWTVGSDTQRYKQCGNAVTVNVVRDVALRLLSASATPNGVLQITRKAQ
jgi:DNA (cytosine-5)-methyltransferase 1